MATPAWSQGVVSSPDDSGPSATDYSGFSVVALISGVRKDTGEGQETEVLCTNVGTSAVQWAVQVFNAQDPGSLTCESTDSTSLGVGDVDNFTTDSVDDDFNLSGTCPDGGGVQNSAIGRVIVDGKKADLVCSAHVIDTSTRNFVTHLPITLLGKPPKIKIK